MAGVGDGLVGGEDKHFRFLLFISNIINLDKFLSVFFTKDNVRNKVKTTRYSTDAIARGLRSAAYVQSRSLTTVRLKLLFIIQHNASKTIP